jgi:hypothetical protein
LSSAFAARVNCTRLATFDAKAIRLFFDLPFFAAASFLAAAPVPRQHRTATFRWTKAIGLLWHLTISPEVVIEVLRFFIEVLRQANNLGPCL